MESYGAVWWQPREGYASVLFDNWTQLRALHYQIPISQDESQLDSVHQLYNEEGWKNEVVYANFSDDIWRHILTVLGNITTTEGRDIAWWMPKGYGKFKVSSVWDSCRRKGDPTENYL
ncbi:hypothetical protein RDI58_023600 [Solanum bulbocastanum]|uniref:Uncharacterized protein n=1 Tax=Solanum bulbocastanum TaxID=147425 RepID=A0AAN8TCV0_SOLBU